MEQEKKEVKELKFNVDTVIYFLYLLYKCNMLSRHNIQQIFDQIKKEHPADIMKYLVSEVQKSG